MKIPLTATAHSSENVNGTIGLTTSVTFTTATIPFATSASYAANAGSGGGTTLTTGSTYQVTSSWTQQALVAETADVALYSNISSTTVTSSMATTASFAISASYAPLSFVYTGSWRLDPSQSFQSFVDAPYTQPYQEGKLFWDWKNRTYSVYNDSSDVTLQLGQENMVRVIAGEDLSDGQVVYISGSHTLGPRGNNRPICKLALADGNGTRVDVLGVATHTISSGSAGWVTTLGIVNDIDTSAFADGDILYLSDTIAGGLTNNNPLPPKETVKIAQVLVSDASVGQIYVAARPPFETPAILSAGMTAVPSISHSAGTVYVGTGSVNLYNNEIGNDTLRNYYLQSASLSQPTTGSNYYIYADYNGGSPEYKISTDRNLINQHTTVNVYTTLRTQCGVCKYLSWDVPGWALSNNLLKRFIRTQRVAHESGLALGESGSRAITTTAGVVWVGDHDVDVTGSNSQFPNQAFRLYYHDTGFTGAKWTSSLQTQYNNTQYDNGSALVALGAGRYAVNFVYRSIATDTNMPNTYTVLGTGNYNLAQAQASQPPANLPSMLSDVGGTAVLVGRIIVVRNAATSTQIDSAWTTQFTPSPTTDHNALSNIQGGGTDDYYHLTANQASFVGIYTTSSFSSSFASSSISSSFAHTCGTYYTGSKTIAAGKFVSMVVDGTTYYLPLYV